MEIKYNSIKQDKSRVNGEKIKLCMVGAGSFAHYAHGPSLRLIAGHNRTVELSGVADLDAGTAADFAEEFGFRHSYSDWRTMLDREMPDGVIVLTPVAKTSETGCRILEAGFPVMLEKPPGSNVHEIQNLIIAAKGSGKGAMVAYNRRYSPILKQLNRILKDECGEVLEHVRCDFFRNERFDHDFSTTAIHGIDTLSFLAGGAYSSVDFHYQRLRRECEIYNIFLNAVFANNVSGLISFCPSTGAAFERFTLTTRHWTFIAETVIPGGGSDWPGRICVYKNGSLLRTEGYEASPYGDNELYLAGYLPENIAFIENLRNGFTFVCDLETTLDEICITNALRHHEDRWYPYTDQQKYQFIPELELCQQTSF